MKQPDQPQTIAAYMDERVNELRLLVPQALTAFDVEAIHDSRVSTRRLTAAVRLLGPVLSTSHRKTFEKALKKLRKRLGPLRDMDVILAHLDEMPEAKKHAVAVEWLKRELADQRDDCRNEQGGKKAVTKTLASLGEWWGLHAEVDEASEAVGHLIAESTHQQLDAFAEQADRLAAGPGKDGQRQDPHQLRIAGKELRYTLELADITGHALPAGALKSFKAMQEALGHWHDMVVLSGTILRLMLDCDLGLHESDTAAQVMDLAKISLSKSAKSMGTFSSHWTSSGKELVKSIREAFPLTKPAESIIEPKTDLDPAEIDALGVKQTSPPASPPAA